MNARALQREQIVLGQRLGVMSVSPPESTSAECVGDHPSCGVALPRRREAIDRQLERAPAARAGQAELGVGSGGR